MVTCEGGQVGNGTDLEVHRDQGSLGVCRLGPETVTCAAECGSVCLTMRTKELPPRPHPPTHTPRGITTKPFTRSPGQGRADLEHPDHMGVCPHRRKGATRHTNA